MSWGQKVLDLNLDSEDTGHVVSSNLSSLICNNGPVLPEAAQDRNHVCSVHQCILTVEGIVGLQQEFAE